MADDDKTKGVESVADLGADLPKPEAEKKAKGPTPPKEKPPVPTDDPKLNARFKQVRGIAEECVSDDELRALLFYKEQPRCYDGFEPSGRVHIAQGVMKALNVNKLTQAGCHFVFWVADWFALMNNKLGGDLKKIQTVGRYMIEVWKAAGMELEHVEFLWSSEEINRRPDEYWNIVLDISSRTTVTRVKRCATIMGRKEADEMMASQIFYPCMQAADIFFLKADICQLGMDQRKVNMLARDYCTAIKRKNKPIILSHHMLMGLEKGMEKMSKSSPDSAIFMEDDEATVKSKIKKSFCPPGEVEKNPCLEYCKYIVFPKFGQFEIKRDEANGGDKLYTSYEDLEADYVAGAVHPGDLKPALVAALNECIRPVREHFENNAEAKNLLKQVKQIQKWDAQRKLKQAKAAAAAAQAAATEAAT